MNKDFMRIIVGLLTGIIFGLGLAVSEMTNPEKVLAFLDVLGDWDPGLLLTMAGAVMVTFVGYRLASRKPLLDEGFSLPTNSTIDRPLIMGSVLFGIGWGIAGYCPGPAISGLSTGATEAFVVLATIIAGNRLHDFLAGRRHG